jgi:hypothetical protein
MQDLKSYIKPVLALASSNIASNTTTAGNVITTQGFSSLTFIINVNARTDGTITPLIQHSDDGVSFADVDDYFLIGTEANASISTANTNKTIGYVGCKPFVKASLVSSGVTSGLNASIQAILGHPANAPVL